MHPSGSKSKEPPTIGGKIASTLFLAIFFLMGSGFLVLMSYSLFNSISPFFWADTSCTIVSSRIEDEGRNGHNRYVYKINYSYEFKGARYNSDKVSSGYAGDSTCSKAQILMDRYPVGSSARCLVNPGNPSEAVLTWDCTSLIMLPFMLIPIIFVLVGAGGIYSVWTGWSITDSIKGNRDPEKRPKTGRIAVLFFSTFLLIGLAVFYFIGIRPGMKMLDARNWQLVPCKIISSSVAKHDSDDGHTYSIDILYSYGVGGKEYKSDRYNFIGGSSSGYAGKKKIADSFPAGSNTNCYVNPADPADAVLDRKPSWEFLFCLIPLVFIALGAAGIAYVIRKNYTCRTANGEYDKGGCLDYDHGETVLKPVAGPIITFLGSMLLAGFWNGIVSIFLFQCASGWMNKRPDWFLTIFLIPFVLVGLLLIFLVCVGFIAIFNPRPKIHVNTRTPRQGEKLTVRWGIGERSAEVFRHLLITVNCRRGNDRKSYLERFTVLDTDDSMRMISGSKDIIIPEDAPASEESGNDKLQWFISLHAKLKNRPKIEFEYPIKVIPKRR